MLCNKNTGPNTHTNTNTGPDTNTNTNTGPHTNTNTNTGPLASNSALFQFGTICLAMFVLIRPTAVYMYVQGVFLTGPPPKSSKYKKLI